MPDEPETPADLDNPTWRQDSLITPDQKVWMSTPNPGLVRMEYMYSVVNAKGWDAQIHGILKGPHLLTASGVMGIYRNMAVETFLAQPDIPWMLCIDSDIFFDETAPYQILETALAHNAKIVTGAYVLPQDGGLNVSIFNKKRDPNNGLLRAMPTPLSEMPTEDLITADACGAGFLLIHRDVFHHFLRHFPPQHCWFAEEVIGGVISGEDLTFCDRARSLGYEILFDLSIKLGHLKTLMLTTDTKIA